MRLQDFYIVQKPVREGGNVFAGRTSAISRNHIKPTLDRYFAELAHVFPRKKAIFDLNHFVPLGSVGKKSVSGDIDLGVSAQSLLDKDMSAASISEWGIDPAGVDAQQEKLTRRARTSTPEQLRMKAFLQLLAEKINSTAPNLHVDPKKITPGNMFGLFPQYDADGNKLDLGVQIDWMVGDLDWLTFSYYSSAYPEDSNVKGLHRTQLMLSAFQVADLSFDHVKGVRDKESGDTVATNPEQALAILNDRLGTSIDRDTTENYYALHDALRDQLTAEQYDQLTDIYFKILDRTRTDIPDDMQQLWKEKQQKLGLTGKFLPDNSALAPLKLTESDKPVKYNPLAKAKYKTDAGGIQLDVSIDGSTVDIRAMAMGRQLGYVVFGRDGGTLVPDDLAVDERFRGQGIASIMYDHARDIGFTIRRSNDQTDAGRKFWDKYKPYQNIWEEEIIDELSESSTDITENLRDWFGKISIKESGVAGASRVTSRQDFEKFLHDYERLISQFPGYQSMQATGSYHSDPSKEDFGDIDLVVHIQSDADKAQVKRDLAQFLQAQPETVIVPFGGEKHAGKRTYNAGELVSVRFHSDSVGDSAQIDNIIALSPSEAEYKSGFLNYPAPKQGLILGLVKVAAQETDPARLFDMLGIDLDPNLPENQEWEFNISPVELQLRQVTYEPGTTKQVHRDIVWRSRDIGDLQTLLYQYDLDTPFEDLLAQAQRTVQNPRSGPRIVGLFQSMITVKSGEVGTAKAQQKQQALAQIQRSFTS